MEMPVCVYVCVCVYTGIVGTEVICRYAKVVHTHTHTHTHTKEG